MSIAIDLEKRSFKQDLINEVHNAPTKHVNGKYSRMYYDPINLDLWMSLWLTERSE